eukprot:5273867-Prymnesium_polylepis.1
MRPRPAPGSIHFSSERTSRGTRGRAGRGQSSTRSSSPPPSWARARTTAPGPSPRGAHACAAPGGCYRAASWGSW